MGFRILARDFLSRSLLDRKCGALGLSGRVSATLHHTRIFQQLRIKRPCMERNHQSARKNQGVVARVSGFLVYEAPSLVRTWRMVTRWSKQRRCRSDTSPMHFTLITCRAVVGLSFVAFQLRFIKQASQMVVSCC